MKNKKIIIYFSLIALILSAAFSLDIKTIQAQTPPNIIITPDPIFNNVTNFLPEDVANSTVTITNNSGKDYERITLSSEVPTGESDDLASALELKVDDLAIMDLDALLNGGIIVLSGKLESGSPRTFDFAMNFKERGENIDNPYQGESVVFNFIFTFKGGEVEDGDGNGVKMVVSGGGGGGGGGMPPGLIILNETAITTCNSATINWLTSYPSTSQIIYSAEGESHTLDLDAPNYGYAHAYPDPEDDTTKVTGHTVIIPTLAASTDYYFRCVSHASPDTIGYEGSFTTENYSTACPAPCEPPPADEPGGETPPESPEGPGLPDSTPPGDLLPMPEPDAPAGDLAYVPPGTSPKIGEELTPEEELEELEEKVKELKEKIKEDAPEAELKTGFMAGAILPALRFMGRPIFWALLLFALLFLYFLLYRKERKKEDIDQSHTKF